MKICVILSPSGSFENLNQYQNLLSTLQSNHQFVCKFISEEIILNELDKICSENYEFYWPIFSQYTVVEKSILECLENKRVHLLGPSLKFFGMSTSDIKRLVSSIGIKIMPTTNSHNDWIEPAFKISFMILETNSGVIAFPFTAVKLDKVEDELFKNLKEMAVRAYESLGVLGSGCAVAHFFVSPQKEIYFHDMCPPVARQIFNEAGGIEKTHPGFINKMIESKLRLLQIASTYDKFSVNYDEVCHQKVNSVLQNLINTYDFSGSVLDLGCGTGLIGKAILAKEQKALITGVDISPEMIKQVKGYSSVHEGSVENVIMELGGKFDHVVSSGLFPFIDSTNFVKILNRSFALARKSVSFTVEDYPKEYNETLIKLDLAHMQNVNHLNDVSQLKIPSEWVLVYRQEFFNNRDFGLIKKERALDFHIPTLRISGLVLRYERKYY